MVRPALEFVVQELEALKQEGLFVNIRTLESPQGAWIVSTGGKCSTCAPTTTSAFAMTLC
jgi:2-amino-3-ketobutyrate coenzyme A ligase (EC 2.3.1.29)